MPLDETRYAREHCRRIFSEVHGVRSEQALALVQESCQLRRYRKKETVIHAGEIPSELPFIISGSIYGYYMDDTGKRITDCIAADYGDPITVATSLEAFSRPSDIYQEALEPLEVVSVPVSVFLHCAENYPDVMGAMGRLLEKWFNRHRKMAIWQSFPLPERYRAFCGEYPLLPERLTKTALASCLNSDLSAVSRLLKQ